MSDYIQLEVGQLWSNLHEDNVYDYIIIKFSYDSYYGSYVAYSIAINKYTKAIYYNVPFCVSIDRINRINLKIDANRGIYENFKLIKKLSDASIKMYTVMM